MVTRLRMHRTSIFLLFTGGLHDHGGVSDDDDVLHVSAVRVHDDHLSIQREDDTRLEKLGQVAVSRGLHQVERARREIFS
jgi:hypothetical protein